MAYPLIILGAGASFDFLKIERHSPNDQHHLSGWRPPLTNNIFDVSRFSEMIGKYEDIKPLASAVINITDTTEPFDFESYLSELEKKYPQRSYPQIITLRFYLAELFSKVSSSFFRHTNNHNHLLYEINNRIGKAIFVNFNYDTLLEKNIRSINSSNTLDSYLSSDIKVIKIHGAHNWVYSPKAEIGKHDVYDYFVSKGKELQSEYQKMEISNSIIDNLDQGNSFFDLNAYKRHEDGMFPGGHWLYYLPAVAVPIASKGDCVCPQSHILALKEELKKVDRILVIGWRAQDKYLLGLLKENLQTEIILQIVSSDQEKAREISLQFADISQIKKPILIGDHKGYTDFMIKRGYEQFFSS